jgi:phospholipid transport system transporter-binding protein
MVVSGELTFHSIEHGWRDASTLICQGSGVLNVALEEVTRCDSAALALLTYWSRLMRRDGRELVYSGLSDQLWSLIEVSDLDGVLPLPPRD